MYFKNRRHAGWLLAKKIPHSLFDNTNTVVVALSNGGVPIALEVARELNLEMNIVLINKIRINSNSDLVIGAVGEEGEVFYNSDYMNYFVYSKSDLEQYRLQACKELQGESEELKIWGNTSKLDNKEIILVDDGVETGATLGLAIQLMKKNNVKKIMVAVPIASPEIIKKITNQVDEMITVLAPQFVNLIEKWYEDFDQVESEEVVNILSDFANSRQYRENKNLILKIQSGLRT